MPTAKEQVRELLEQLQDDATFEDIQYHIYVREKVQHGLQQVEQCRTLPEDEVDPRLSRWLID